MQTQAYHEQYGFNGIYPLAVNLYRPRDSFDRAKSHVIPALIKKCVDAIELGESKIEVWAPGPRAANSSMSRTARAIVLATERYDRPEPVNLGAGREIKIRDLVKVIARLTGFSGESVWDSGKPEGQPRRCLDVSRAQREFGFRATTQFETGLRRTIDWYVATRAAGPRGPEPVALARTSMR